jgi:hypothetical protein
MGRSLNNEDEMRWEERQDAQVELNKMEEAEAGSSRMTLPPRELSSSGASLGNVAPYHQPSLLMLRLRLQWYAMHGMDELQSTWM